MVANPLRYTADSMDEMIRVVGKHRQKLISQGHIDHFGQNVHPQPAPAGPDVPPPVTHKAYCVKCKAKKDVQSKKVDVMDNGAHKAVGHCPTCGTETHAMMSASDGQKLKDSLTSTLAQTGGR